MDDQTELALNSDQPSSDDAGPERDPSANAPMHATHNEHAILDEFLSGSDQGYMRPSAETSHGLGDWLKRARSKSAAAVNLWFPPWLSAKAREDLQSAPLTPAPTAPSSAFSTESSPASSPPLPILTRAAAPADQALASSWLPDSRPVLVSTALALAAVATATGALWISAGFKADLDQLSTELAQVRNQALHPAATETDLELLAVRGQLDGLRTRIAELSDASGQAIPQTEQQQAKHQQLLTRISELEQIASQWEQQQLVAAQQATAPLPPSAPTPKPKAQPVAKSPAPTEKPVNPAAAPDIPVAPTVVAAPVVVTATNQATAKSPTPVAAPVATPVITAAKTAAPKPSKRRSGPWVVNLLSVTSRAEANREIKRLKKMDILAEVQSAKVKQQTWYRIRVTGFATSGEAQDFGDRIAVQTGLKGAWAARK